MLTPAPLIGVVADQHNIVSTRHHDRVRPFVGVFAAYLRCLVAAGAMPVIIPPDLPAPRLRGIVERLDGVLLTGGGDIDPAEYGEADAHKAACEVNPTRDAAEIQVSRWAAAEDLPLLGICRGHQVVNVALGGRLYVDIPSQVSSHLTHATPPDKPLDYYAHDVIIEPGSRLAAILGVTRLATNSRHHQAVRETGQGLVVSARTSDGLIEATEKPDARFFLSVQWHPENLYDHDPAMPAIFGALVQAAACYCQDRLEAEQTA